MFATVPPTAPPTTLPPLPPAVTVASWDGWVEGGWYFVAGVFCASLLLVLAQFRAPDETRGEV